MGPRGRFYPYLCILHILDCLRQDMQVLYLGRALRTKETLPDFLKWRRVTRPPLVFRRLTGSQRTPGFWGVTAVARLGGGNSFAIYWLKLVTLGTIRFWWKFRLISLDPMLT